MKPDTLRRLEALLLMLADETGRGSYERGIVIAALALLAEIKPPTADAGVYRVQ